jgi:membrane-associated phospholipid phosphatase
MRWQWIALGYMSYLAVVSLTRRKFTRARLPLLLAAALAWLSYAAATVQARDGAPPGPVLGVVLPALVLLTGYWLSGLLFVGPDLRIEGRLRAIDNVLLMRSGVLAWFRRAPGAVIDYFELSYLLVYVLVPAGAATLALAGHANRVAGFWTVVLLAEFTCYGALPWIQTRPPRVLEDDVVRSPHPRLMRRLNLGVVGRVSIQANTVPSGHAAGAFATALAVGAVMPLAGAIYLTLAASIAVATVLGRYHYVVDSVLGVLVAVAAWALMSHLPVN